MSTIKVVHIMADGELRDSIEGITPPASCGCWAVMREIEKRRQKDDKAGTRGQPEAAAGSGERRKRHEHTIQRKKKDRCESPS